MKKSFLLFLTIALFSCQEAKKSKSKVKKTIDPKVLVSCEGIGEVKLSDTHQTLEERFGKGALAEHENTIYGAFTTIWEADPKQISVYWKEKQAPFKTINFIEVGTPGSPYMTKDSIMVGMGLRDMVKKNGSISIKFLNITQSQPGLITGFNAGNIEKSTPCFTGILEQTRLHVIHKDELKEFHKQKEVNSYDPMLNRIDYELASMRVVRKQ
ncbi:hypothetical protein [Desertivirga arenae]|uniref:hypothetical protein n=1 Tax=Desertivirga arenae TaxID=2810309 RepID=UPI001A96E64C|nr:hypothetical protein [Pedobacter sp. SYSU D00823]